MRLKGMGLLGTIVLICIVLGGCGFALSESLVFVYDGTNYGPLGTVDFGTLGAGEFFYVDCGVKNLTDENIDITAITVTGGFEASDNGAGLPFGLTAGDTLNIGIAISPVEEMSYNGTITVTAEGARDTFILDLVARGVAVSVK